MAYGIGECEVGREADNNPELTKPSIGKPETPARKRIEYQYSCCTV
jgi:hypothetical protein